VTIMMSLFDEEQIMKSFIKSERADKARENAKIMLKNGRISVEEINNLISTKQRKGVWNSKV